MQKKILGRSERKKVKEIAVCLTIPRLPMGWGGGPLFSFPVDVILFNGKAFSILIRAPLFAFHDATCTLAHADLCSSMSLVLATEAATGRMYCPYQFFLVDLFSCVQSPSISHGDLCPHLPYCPILGPGPLLDWDLPVSDFLLHTWSSLCAWCTVQAQ